MVNLELQISPWIFEKIRNGPNGIYSGAWGKLIHEKNQKQKISWHCPFKVVWVNQPAQKYVVNKYDMSFTSLWFSLFRARIFYFLGSQAWTRSTRSHTWFLLNSRNRPPPKTRPKIPALCQRSKTKKKKFCDFARKFSELLTSCYCIFSSFWPRRRKQLLTTWVDQLTERCILPGQQIITAYIRWSRLHETEQYSLLQL